MYIYTRTHIDYLAAIEDMAIGHGPTNSEAPQTPVKVRKVIQKLGQHV